MRKLLLIALLIPLLCGQSAMQAFPPGMFISHADPASAIALSLDGSNSANTSVASNPVSLTTTKAPGVIVVGIISNATSVTSVTASGLTFTARSSGCQATTNCCYTYTAPYSTNFSGNITALMGSASFTTVSVAGFSGVKTTSFFDANGSLPGLSVTGTTYPTISTSNANDVIFVNALAGSASQSLGAPFTTLTNSSFQSFGYEIVAATQTNITPTGGSPHCAQADAIIKGP